jgi:threonine-phosphate decarboxylase
MEKDNYTFAREHGLTEHHVCDVSAGVCPLGPSRKVKAAVRKAVKHIDAYPDPDSSGLRKFFKSKFGIAEDAAVFANSLKEIVYLIPAVFKPRKVLVAGPAPDIYGDACRDSDAEVVHLSAGEDAGFALNAESIRQPMEGAGLIYVSNPNRITGRLMKKDDLVRIVEAASEQKTLVVVDESLIEFTTDEGLLDEAGKRENLILIRTTANYYGLPGLELAYAAASREVTAELRERKTGDVNMLAAEAAKTAYRDKAYRKLVKDFMEEEKRLMTRSLKKMDKVTFFDSDSNVFLIKMECPEKNVAHALARAGFFVKDCSAIEGLGAHYLRISVRSHDQNQKFLRILRERCL